MELYVALRIARAMWGTTLLSAPGQLLQLGGARSPGLEAVTRLLGMRDLAQTAILTWKRYTVPPRWTVAIDLVHATSMIGVALFSRRLRRDALASAGIAGMFAGWAELERTRR